MDGAKENVVAIACAFLFLASLTSQHVSGQFFIGFYNLNCPTAESLVTSTMTSAVQNDPTIAASILRLFFHDCFVEGCDGSILLDTTAGLPIAEKSAPPNQSLRGYEVIDAAKAAVEAACPGIVSCADIVALAARDAVVLSGGPTWQVFTGRRDGTISLGIDAGINIPASTSTAAQLTQNFVLHGLTQDEMITLSGAHTIGRAHCSSFTNRLYNFNATFSTDPSLDPTYAAQLKALCPSNANANIKVPLDLTTPNVFDNNYYTNLPLGKGLMTSDQTLYNSDAFTQFVSQTNSQNAPFWNVKFTNAMIRLGSLNLKLGTQGEIRKNCHSRGS